MSTSEPKTREEILAEKLREVDGRLSKVKRVLATTAEKELELIARAEARHAKASGKPQFVTVGSDKVVGTDRLAALLALEESYQRLSDLEGKEPVKEAEKLITKKIKLMKELIPLGSSKAR